MIEKTMLAISVRLTDAQIKALPSGVVEIIPAAGQNKIIVPVSSHLHLKSVGAYTNFDPLMAFQLIRGTLGMPIFNVDQIDLLLGNAVDTDANMLLTTAFDAPASIINKPLNLSVTNALGALTGGDATNQLTLTIIYWIMHV